MFLIHVSVEATNPYKTFFSCHLKTRYGLGIRRSWQGFGRSPFEAKKNAVCTMIRSQLAIVVRHLTYWAWQPLISKILLQAYNQSVISSEQLHEITPSFDRTQRDYCQLFNE